MCCKGLDHSFSVSDFKGLVRILKIGEYNKKDRKKTEGTNGPVKDERDISGQVHSKRNTFERTGEGGVWL